MKNGQNQRRSRGRSSNKNQGRKPDGNRNDQRMRGNAPQLLEKYKGLARDALAAGDRILAENYFQFADHYQRLVNERDAARAAQQEEREARRAQQREQNDPDSTDQDGAEAAVEDGPAEPVADASSKEARPRRPSRSRRARAAEAAEQSTDADAGDSDACTQDNATGDEDSDGVKVASMQPAAAPELDTSTSEGSTQETAAAE